jgi:hypothetical protein
LVVANPICREVLPRMLAGGPQDSLPQISPSWLTLTGELDPEALLGSAPYYEIAPHLLLMAFLQRVVNR